MKVQGNRKVAVALAVACGLCLAAPVVVQAGLGQALVRGITYTLTPSIGTPQNGPSFNQNSFNQRFSRNYLTDGQSYEFERFFGSDSYGNPDTINTGLFDVQLGAPPGTGLQGAGIYNRVGYNLKVIPEVYWNTRTTGRNINTFVGSASIPAPVQYHIDANNGIAQYTLDGNILVNSAGSVNALGFYNVQFTANNNGTLKDSSVAGDHTQDTSFDLGPVNLSGNIFIDMALAGLKSVAPQLGIPGDVLPPGPTARTRTPDEISKAVAAGQSITGPELQTLLAAYFNDPNSVTLPSAHHDGETTPPASAAALPVPEPGTAGLLVLGGMLVGALRRPRRR